MRLTSLVLALALVPALAAAQQHDTLTAPQLLPRSVAREVVAHFNSTSTVRTTDRLDVAAGQEVRGDVAVISGPVFVAGHIAGDLVAINADVILNRSARIDGDLLVVGGEVEGRNDAYIGGEVRIYRQRLYYTQQGDSIVADSSATEEEAWWRPLERRWMRSRSNFQVASAGAYNRVEGLPINLGPQINRMTPWGNVRLDAYGVFRTGSSFNSSDNDVGHNVRLEARYGRRAGVGVGGRLYNVVEGVENWHLNNLEVGLASFLFHRDYRDYYQRHGGSVFASVFGQRDVNLTAAFSHERWAAREDNNPFTLFRSDAAWRPNPAVDEGTMHIGTATFTIDTRNDVDRPWAGWYVKADWERGQGTLTSVAPTSQPRSTAPGPITYTRGFLDVRRYNRLSPDAQINMRVVLGGWLGGDPLPLERRLSVSSAGTLPGFDFRSPGIDPDVSTCTSGAAVSGRPAECERILLAQVEYRGVIHVNMGRNDDRSGDGSYDFTGLHADGAWVLFLDAGRGWLVGDNTAPLTYGSGSIPDLSTFRSDVGAGLDFGRIGVFVAKALSTSGEPANVFVRLTHRF